MSLEKINESMDPYFLSPMKYNRIVIFRTDLWHSHNYNFGDSFENGRLVQLFSLILQIGTSEL